MNTNSEFPEVLDVEHQIASAMNAAAVVDRSSSGRIRVSGSDRLDLLHRLSTNDLLSLSPYSSTGTVFTTDKGRIVDYVRIIVHPDTLVLLTSPGQEEKVKGWIEKYTIMEDVQVRVITDETKMVSLLGPDALSVAKEAFPQVPTENKNCVTQVQGITVTLDNQQEFSMSCLNILLPTVRAGMQNAAYEMILSKCKQMSIEAYECLRIMSGMPGGGTELIESLNPLEVGLRHGISFTKGCYIGQEVIARLDTYQKVQRGLVLLGLENAILSSKQHLPITNDLEEIGVLTSAAKSPYQSKYPALGVLKLGKVKSGDSVVIKTQPFDIKGVVQTIFEQSPS